MSRPVNRICASVGLLPLAAILLYSYGRGCSVRETTQPLSHEANPLPRDKPLHFAATSDFRNLVDLERLRAVLCQVVPRWDSYRSSNMVHAVRLWGISFDPIHFQDLQTKHLPLFPSGEQMVSWLLDAKSTHAVSRGSEPLLYDSRFGVSVREPGNSGGTDSGLMHADQLIAAMGELGIPSSRAVRTASGTEHSFRALIADSMARFHFSQEVEWTTVAYCYWLPPSRSWVNRFGQRTSFEDLANRLIERPLGEGSCKGTHVPYALTILLRADDEHRIITAPTRTKIEKRLAMISELLERNQYRGGAWNSDWAHESLDTNTRELSYDSLLTTGHHLEWIALAPAQCRPGRSAVARAIDFLFFYVPNHEPATVSHSYDPFSHAARALTLMANSHPVSLFGGGPLAGEDHDC